MTVRVVSNTQVTTKSVCDRQHFYRFILGIEPLPGNLSPALYRGIIGHEALEVYYTWLMNGQTVESARLAALEHLEAVTLKVVQETPEAADRVILLAELSQLIDAYSRFYGVEPFEVIAVEQVYQAPIGEDLYYGMKLDVLIKYTSGEFRGDYAIFDHKFVYNFKDAPELEMDGQMPKYQKTLRENGIIVSKAVFNQIRYRKINDPHPNQIFRRTPARLNPTKTAAIWDEQKEIAQKIVDDEATQKRPLRTLSLLVCRNCHFYELCNADMMGQNTELMVSTNYQKSTYGYTNLENES